jgi:hypothetical protein
MNTSVRRSSLGRQVAGKVVSSEHEPRLGEILPELSLELFAGAQITKIFMGSTGGHSDQ